MEIDKSKEKGEINILSEKCIDITATESEVQRLVVLFQKLIIKAKKTPKIIEDVEFDSNVLNIASQISLNLAGDLINVVDTIQSLRLKSFEKDVDEFKEKVIFGITGDCADQPSSSNTPESKQEAAKRRRISAKLRKAEKFKESINDNIRKFEDEWNNIKLPEEINFNEGIPKILLEAVTKKENIMELGKKLASEIKVEEAKPFVKKKQAKKRPMISSEVMENDPFFEVATKGFVEGNLDGLLSFNCIKKQSNYIISNKCLYDDDEVDNSFETYVQNREKFSNPLLRSHAYFFQELRKPTVSQDLYQILDAVPIPEEFLSEEERLAREKNPIEEKYPDFSDKPLDSDDRPYVYTKMSFIDFEIVPNDWLTEKGIPLEVQQKIYAMFHQDISPIKEMYDEVKKYITNEFEFDCTILKVKTTLNEDEINAETLEPMYDKFFDPLGKDRLNLNFCNDIDLMEKMKNGKIYNLYIDGNKKPKQIFKRVDFDVPLTPENFYTSIVIPREIVANNIIDESSFDEITLQDNENIHLPIDNDFDIVDNSLNSPEFNRNLENTENNTDSTTQVKNNLKRKKTSSKKSVVKKKCKLTRSELKKSFNTNISDDTKSTINENLKLDKKSKSQLKKQCVKKESVEKKRRKRRARKMLSSDEDEKSDKSLYPSLKLKTNTMEKCCDDASVVNVSLTTEDSSRIGKIDVTRSSTNNNSINDEHISTTNNLDDDNQSANDNDSIDDIQITYEENSDDNMDKHIVDNKPESVKKNLNDVDGNVYSNKEELLMYLNCEETSLEKYEEDLASICITNSISQNDLSDQVSPKSISTKTPTNEETPSRRSYAVSCIGTKEQKKKSLAFSQTTVLLDDHKIKRCICYTLESDVLCASYLSACGDNNITKEDTIKRIEYFVKNYNIDVNKNGGELPKSLKVVNHKEIRFVYELVKSCLGKPYESNLSYVHFANMLLHLCTKYRLTITKTCIQNVNPIPCEKMDFIINFEDDIEETIV